MGVRLGVGYMPADGENLDELLSGFIDGELNDQELQLVNESLRDNPSTLARVADLRRQSQLVYNLGQAIASHAATSHPAASHSAASFSALAMAGQPSGKSHSANVPGCSDFAKSIIAKARQRAIESGLPAEHYVHGAGHANDVGIVDPGTSSTAKRSSRRFAVLAAGGLTIAASLALLFAWPGGSGEKDPPLAVQPEEAAISEPAVVYVDELPQLPPITYVLVVDVQVTAEAWKAKVLEDIWASAGIAFEKPVSVNSEISKAVDDALVISQPSAQDVEEKFVHVIRANMEQIDDALDIVWSDNVSFPKVKLNFAIDVRAELVRLMLKGMGKRFSASESFALPLSPAESTGVPSPFVGAEGSVKYISSVERNRGWEASPLAQGRPSEMATVLVITHIAN